MPANVATQNLPQFTGGMAIRTVLFFIAGSVMTSNEATLYNAVFDQNNLGIQVEVRDIAQDDGVTIEPNIYGVMSYYPVAIPARYAALVTAQTIKSLSAFLAGAGASLSLFAPAAVGGSFSHTTTSQLCLISIGPDGNPVEVTKASGVTYASSATGVATVNSTGLVTGVAAGTTIITASWVIDAHNTVTATKTLTLT